MKQIVATLLNKYNCIGRIIKRCVIGCFIPQRDKLYHISMELNFDLHWSGEWRAPVTIYFQLTKRCQSKQNNTDDCSNVRKVLAWHLIFIRAELIRKPLATELSSSPALHSFSSHILPFSHFSSLPPSPVPNSCSRQLVQDTIKHFKDRWIIRFKKHHFTPTRVQKSTRIKVYNTMTLFLFFHGFKICTIRQIYKKFLT